MNIEHNVKKENFFNLEIQGQDKLSFPPCTFRQTNPSSSPLSVAPGSALVGVISKEIAVRCEGEEIWRHNSVENPTANERCESNNEG
ncbi:hypothetical protein K0M31_010079 [Melipona bicolor]|uniref:Uncharacterized protein n=1 Tax=Melipona bicolor TaxID=60889 RepID=A0AA40KIV4_9HYME|nr:hypothetical protein K0M31_010079 [Melipona bicolor]